MTAVTTLAARVGILQERLVAHLFEAAVSLAWAFTGIAYLTSPDRLARSPVGRSVEPFDMIWSGFYVAACPLILYGLWSGVRDWRFRVAGLTLLTAGLIMQGIAAGTYELEPRVALYAVYAAACFLRVAFLTRLLRPIRGG
jgi:hypothetical protein